MMSATTGPSSENFAAQRFPAAMPEGVGTIGPYRGARFYGDLGCHGNVQSMVTATGRATLSCKPLALAARGLSTSPSIVRPVACQTVTPSHLPGYVWALLPSPVLVDKGVSGARRNSK